jgi:addiction module HigA family antidote
MKIPKNRPPAHPGEILFSDFLEPMGLTQRELADAIHVPYQRINELVNGKRGITPSTALRLSKFFGNSSDFWLNLQLNWELYRVLKEEEEDINTILPLSASSLV